MAPIFVDSITHQSYTIAQDVQTITRRGIVTATDQLLKRDGGSESDGSNGIDYDAGSSGTDYNSFKISQGALIAIIVVCVFVVVFGIASTILFVVAKRRQWNIRASIARASRRLTGRFGGSKSQRDVESSRRTGTYYGTKSNPGLKTVTPPGHKRGLVVDVKPVQEKKMPAWKENKSTEKKQEQPWIYKSNGRT